MKIALTGLALALLTFAPGRADAQSVVLVVDSGSVRMNVDALRTQIGEQTGRTLVRLGDSASREATETLTIVRAGAQRWVLRYQRGNLVTWSEPADIRPGALRQTLARAATELLAATRAPVAAPESSGESPVVAGDAATRRGRAEWDHGNEPGRDLVDPFERRRWDPLRDALAGELHHPFRSGETPPFCVGLVDPFVADRSSYDLLDPWAMR